MGEVEENCISSSEVFVGGSGLVPDVFSWEPECPVACLVCLRFREAKAENNVRARISAAPVTPKTMPTMASLPTRREPPLGGAEMIGPGVSVGVGGSLVVFELVVGSIEESDGEDVGDISIDDAFADDVFTDDVPVDDASADSIFVDEVFEDICADDDSELKFGRAQNSK